MKSFNSVKNIIIIIVYALLVYYLIYPPLNVTNMSFWMYLLSIFIVFFLLNFFNDFPKRIENIFFRRKSDKLLNKYKLFLCVPIVIVFILLINILLSPFFQSRLYSKRIIVNTKGDFSSEVMEVDFNKIPLLDRDSSAKVGDRTMGQMSELVSQFDVSDQYTQINYNDEIVRVTPLEYNGIIKWFTNRKKGIKGYIIVNSNTGRSKLVKLDKGIKYAPSALFNENLYRKLQFLYPTKNFDSVNFEIDNKGHPYWVASVIKYVGVGLRREVSGVVIFDPINGKSRYYNVKDVPRWVDHVYEADLVLEQVNDWGKYKNGFLNSIISQKGVVETTRGYNYLAQNDDIYLYTGITSVVSDESNIGFILTNLRTKETTFYNVAGAEEYSAMDSAKGQVQQMSYTSTFPLLINLNGKPTYLISLKDNAGLVKMYAFVDVVDYQKVVVTDSSSGIRKAADNYLNEIGDDLRDDFFEKEIIVNDLTSVEIDGNTYYYLRDDDNQKYKISIKVNKNLLPFIRNGDTIKIKYAKENDVISVVDVSTDY